MPIKKASERLQVHPTSITNAVDRLESAGLVRRMPHPDDGRATLLAATDAGRERALEATEQLNSAVFAHPGLAPGRVRTLDLGASRPAQERGRLRVGVYRSTAVTKKTHLVVDLAFKAS